MLPACADQIVAAQCGCLGGSCLARIHDVAQLDVRIAVFHNRTRPITAQWLAHCWDEVELKLIVTYSCTLRAVAGQGCATLGLYREWCQYDVDQVVRRVSRLTVR